MLSDLKGLGKRKLQLLNELGIYDTRDLVYYFPATFEDRRTPVDFWQDSTGYFVGRVIRKQLYQPRGKKSILTIEVAGEIPVRVLFFNSNYLEPAFVFQRDYVFYGKLERKANRLQMVHPAFAPIEKQAGFLDLVPRYRLKKGLYQSDMMSFIDQILEQPLPDLFDQTEREAWDLMPLAEALRQMHRPSGKESYKRALYRLIYEDFFRYLIANRSLRQQPREAYRMDRQLIDRFLGHLPFDLTPGQLRIIDELYHDLTSGYQMSRLIQGDVGSGKSVLAYFGLFAAVSAARQGVYLAPTELLATQQAEQFSTLFPEIRSQLLTSVTKQKKTIYQQLLRGEIEVLIGTHAVLQEAVRFKALDMIVTDEQHRFGVNQREQLKDKADLPHILMMSATPIPRTMSMIMHQNISLSNLSDKPAGRLPIQTKLLPEAKRNLAYQHIQSEIDQGHKAYIVFPLIEESDVLEAQSLEENALELTKRFGDKVAFLHGRMSSEDKTRILEDFKAGRTPVLAATSLIEVGIDVSDATVLLLRNAERFGLSQIHQIRGRIGRSDLPSTCFLTYQSKIPERLKILAEEDDGFVIAEKDLELRGPGELMGTRQSGNFQFPVADVFRHSHILKQVDARLSPEIIEKYQTRLHEEVKL
ncbi:MAG TPA: ATP-dependent DNA helicase RecG [Tissierellia bacterium]|nr:ATP-dependent DNA helicase RecG [Tissierellia bacterium]